MKFIFDIKNPQQQYIQITAEIKSSGDETEIFLPAWRPGRYELGDFAKNINHFGVFNEKGEDLHFAKQNKNTWLVQSKGTEVLIVKYSYYAAELNAGSTYLDATQLYVNPVNCCVFTDDTYDDEISVQLNIPDEWKVANPLKTINKQFKASNFDELADSPFICSSQLQHKSYEVDGTTFHIWLNGIIKPDWERLIVDFKKFTESQIKRFLIFPTDEYHFLCQIVPYKLYHGVEHCKSTVIALGPSYAVFGELYKELLGVSSHELYHTWNVKAIRPIEWTPYDFKKESYSKLGYIAEGVTTYMGDLFLYKSGVFTLDQYLLEMNTQIQKHKDNFGRYNYSVADSSFDTWLDGYTPGAPARKVSIYTEGCLLSFMLDVHLLKFTDNNYRLDDVMTNLYHKYAIKGIGVTEEIYQTEIEKFTNTSMQWFFDDYVNGTKDYTPELIKCFNAVGLKLYSAYSGSEFASYLGAKIITESNETTVLSIYPNSPLDTAGAIIGDKVISVNDIVINNDAEEWAKFFRDDDVTVTVARKGQLIQLQLPKGNRTNQLYYKRYYLRKIADDKLTQEQKQTFESWSDLD